MFKLPLVTMPLPIESLMSPTVINMMQMETVKNAHTDTISLKTNASKLIPSVRHGMNKTEDAKHAIKEMN